MPILTCPRCHKQYPVHVDRDVDGAIAPSEYPKMCEACYSHISHRTIMVRGLRVKVECDTQALTAKAFPWLCCERCNRQKRVALRVRIEKDTPEAIDKAVYEIHRQAAEYACILCR